MKKAFFTDSLPWLLALAALALFSAPVAPALALAAADSSATGQNQRIVTVAAADSGAPADPAVSSAPAAQKPQTAPAAQSVQTFAAINGLWVVDMEATAKVYQIPQDLAKDLDGLTVSFEVKQNKLVAAWADGSGESHDYQVTTRQPGAAKLRIGNKYDLSLDFSQAGVLVLTENGNSLVLKRAPAVKP